MNVSEMTNDEIFMEMTLLSKTMRALEKARDFHERNKLVLRWNVLHTAYDFGFSVGEKVETKVWGHLQTAMITKIEGTQFHVRNDKGWDVITSGFTLKKLSNAPVVEQIDMFEVLDS